ncbi:MAG: lipoyl(octanoyl) transferase LipB [Alphaproteobacteria bacterium]|nr:lipoyl(octanoyl) transferase LipB [Alphaproteobacteria bacterium]
MDIEIKKSKKPISYKNAISFLEKRLKKVNDKKSNELIWILEHDEVFTGGKTYSQKDILDKSIRVIQTNRGGKITYHGPGQLVCYFILDLKSRKKDIRQFIKIIEKTIIETLNYFNIDVFADNKNIGIWYKDENEIKKVAAIGLRISKWIVYHGFSINVNNSLYNYKKIIPCGITDRGVTNLKSIKDQNYKNLKNILIDKLIINLKN